MKKLLPGDWRVHEVLILGILLTIGARLADPLISFALGALQRAAG
jgi:hypothetical protein